jgi:hypothetical protein
MYSSSWLRDACLMQSLKFPRFHASGGSRACEGGARRSMIATPAIGSPNVSFGAWIIIGCALLCVATLSVTVEAGEGGPIAKPPGGDGRVEEQDVWRIENRCGINSLYVFIRLLGQPVSYDEILRDVPVREFGTSMAELKSFLSARKIACAIVRCTPDNLHRQPLPAIAYISVGGEEQGHFVVVCAVNGKTLRLVDGTAGAVYTEAMESFVKHWDGHLLVPVEEPRLASLLWAAVSISGIVLVAQSIVGALLARRTKRGPRITQLQE